MYVLQYSIYDVSGRLIASVDQENQVAGNYSVRMNEDLAPGTYLIGMKIGELASVQRYLVTR